MKQTVQQLRKLANVRQKYSPFTLLILLFLFIIFMGIIYQIIGHRLNQ